MAAIKQAIVFIFIDGQPVPAGMLTTSVDGRYTSSEFSYGSRYIERPDAIPVDPVALPLPPPGRKDVVYRTKADFSVFNGIRDAGPDKWGRYLLDKKYPASGLDEFDYIVSSGPDRVGALAFGADPQSGVSAWDGSKFIPAGPDTFPDLAQIQRAVDHAGDPDDPDFQKLLDYGPSLGGARPKGTVIWNDRFYLAKFSLKSDGWNICRGEFATMKLASACGMNVPNVDITEVLGKSVYLIERFDRVDSDRIPFHSALTMTDSHESDYGRHSYRDIIDAISRFSPDPDRDRKELYRRMVFNIFCSNTDDHMRNHGMVYAGNWQWKLSPLYDVVPFPQNTNSWSLALHIGDQGRSATVENVLAAAPGFGIRNAEANFFIEHIRDTCKNWRSHYAECGLTEQDIQKISSCFHITENDT
jgi:serine/threonine-protein kinase HipA